VTSQVSTSTVVPQHQATIADAYSALTVAQSAIRDAGAIFQAHDSRAEAEYVRRILLKINTLMLSLE